MYIECLGKVDLNSIENYLFKRQLIIRYPVLLDFLYLKQTSLLTCVRETTNQHFDKTQYGIYLS